MADCEPIISQTVEETIATSIVEEAIQTTVAEEVIQAPVVEEAIQAVVGEDAINVLVETWPGTDFSPEHMIYVAKNGSDTNNGARNNPFLTIQAGIDAAYLIYGPIANVNYGVVILVAPGIYEEQVHSYAGYHIQGYTHEASPERKTAVIYNTGADADHYPLRGDDGDKHYLEGINVEVAPGGTIGKICDGFFTKVNFRYGCFIESTEIENTYSSFQHCTFNQVGFNFTGATANGRRTVRIVDSWFSRYSWVTTSTHDTLSAFHIVNCAFNRAYPNLGGDWKMQIRNSHIFGSAKTQIDTTGDLFIVNSVISNGLHFVSDPANVGIEACSFNDNEGYPITGEDITADVVVTNVLYTQNIQQNGINGRIQTVGNVVNVGGDSVNRYYSIQDAIDSLPSGGIITLQPGTYTEQIHSTLDIHIQGKTREGVPAVKSTVLYNTGADSSHYPLGGEDTDVFTISDITIKTDASGVIGKLSASNFTGVVFQNGHFIEATANQSMLMGLLDCSFKDSMAFNLTGVGTGGMRAMTIIGCFFGDSTTHSVLESTNTTTLVIVKNTMFHNFYPDIGGDWKVEFSNCHIFGTSRTVISTTNKISFIQSILSNGLHFTSNPEAQIQLCTFNDGCGYVITGADVTATLNVTNIDYSQNVQQNGICGNIQTLCPIKNVGCYAIDRYISLQDAISSIPASATAVVRISEDFSGLSKLTLPNVGTQITIDGQKKYSLTFTGDVVDITGSQHFGFIDMVKVDGGTIKLNGATAEVSIEANQYVLADLVIDAGGFAIVYKSSLFGPTGKKAITINSLTTPVIIGYSMIEGATGQPAIGVTAECDEKLKIKFSTLISGTPLTVDPIIYTGANKLDVFVYNTGMSGSWNAAEINNKIGNPNLTTDPEITF